MKKNREYIENRILEEAQYMMEHSATVRATASKFGVGKTTVYKDVALRLPLINVGMAKDVRAVLQKNKQERYSRGGQALSRKYKDSMRG